MKRYTKGDDGGYRSVQGDCRTVIIKTDNNDWHYLATLLGSKISCGGYCKTLKEAKLESEDIVDILGWNNKKEI